MAMINIDSGLELHIDHRGRALLYFIGNVIPGQMGCEIGFPLREGGILHIDIHMSGVKVVHLPKPESEAS